MDASELAKHMLEWEVEKSILDAIEDDIKAAVMELEKTQIVGNVRATYSGGRKKYDYQSAAEGNEVGRDIIEEFTVPKVDWRKVCKSVRIDDVPFTQGDPYVTVKLEE